jgi:hypothetical protein
MNSPFQVCPFDSAAHRAACSSWGLAGVEDLRVLADDLVALVAGRLHEGFIDILDGGVEVGDDDALGALLDGHRELAQFGFCLVPLGDVMDDGVKQLAITDVDWPTEGFDMPDRTVGAAMPEAEMIQLGRMGPLHFVVQLVRAQGVDLRDVHRQQLLLRPAIETGRGLVGVDDGAILGVDDEHHRTAVLEEPAVAGFALGELPHPCLEVVVQVLEGQLVGSLLRCPALKLLDHRVEAGVEVREFGRQVGGGKARVEAPGAHPLRGAVQPLYAVLHETVQQVTGQQQRDERGGTSRLKRSHKPWSICATT